MHWLFRPTPFLANLVMLNIRERAQKSRGVPFELFRTIGDFLGGCSLFRTFQGGRPPAPLPSLFSRMILNTVLWTHSSAWCVRIKDLQAFCILHRLFHLCSLLRIPIKKDRHTNVVTDTSLTHKSFHLWIRHLCITRLTTVFFVDSCLLFLRWRKVEGWKN